MSVEAVISTQVIDTTSVGRSLMTAADAAAARTAADAQVTLVSGTNIKTVNSTSLLGSGDITVGLSGTGATDNAALRADGTGGATLQTSAFVIADNATASPNNTVNHASIQATGGTTNVSVSIVPKGTGAFCLAVPDGTATGGNVRGANAVDLQTSRSAATQVASSPNSFAAGSRCTVTGGANGSVAIGYNCNVTDTLGGSVAMGLNSIANYRAVAIGYGAQATIDSIAIGLAANALHAGAVCLMRNSSFWDGYIIWAVGDATGANYNNNNTSIGGTLIVQVSIRTANATPTLLGSLAYTTAMSTRYRHRGVSLEVSFSLVAVRSDGAINRWSRSCLAKDVANYLSVSTLSLISTDTVGTDLTEIPGISFAVTVDTATKSLRVTVTGEAGFAVTGDAATDVITSVGHTLVASDVVVFNDITGGAGLSTNIGGQYYQAIYRVINVSGDTFQLTSANGSSTVAIDFTTAITSGTICRPILWTASNIRFGSCSGAY